MNKSNKEKLTSKGIPKNAPPVVMMRKTHRTAVGTISGQSIAGLYNRGETHHPDAAKALSSSGKKDNSATSLKNVSVLKHWLQEFERKNKGHYEKNLIDNKQLKDVLNHHTNKENLPAGVDDNVRISDTDEPKIVVDRDLFTLDTKEQEDSCQTNNKEMDAKDPEKKEGCDMDVPYIKIEIVAFQ